MSVKCIESANLYTGALKMKNWIIIILRTLQCGHSTKAISSKFTPPSGIIPSAVAHETDLIAVV